LAVVNPRTYLAGIIRIRAYNLGRTIDNPTTSSAIDNAGAMWCPLYGKAIIINCNLVKIINTIKI
jgi:hypothetical protein